ncbi:hypothetical protein GE09DRAFT_172749 [Coniochaeta sp. 2T2.1]|nr:hypothetical protein GE09DRAFT_172749 [Coniochaeta sp. 2T2.1]
MEPAKLRYPYRQHHQHGRLDSAAWQSDFVEGLMIDYRYFDTMNITPRYEFDYGLSYTIFELGDSLVVRSQAKGLSTFPTAANGTYVGGNPSPWEDIITS